MITARQANQHHGLPAHEVVLLLETDSRQGLSDEEAGRRFQRYGENSLPTASTRGPLGRWLSQFNHPLIYILLLSGAVTGALGEVVDAAVIFGVVLVNAVVGFLQESRAEAALDSLRSLVRTPARVVRSGHSLILPSERLVPGDLVSLQAGDKVPADLRLLDGNELQVDESALTGESQPVVKDELVLPVSTPVADRRNMLYSGTLVSAGTGAGVAVATGAETELGRIHRLVGTADSLATPLTRKLAHFSAVLMVAIVALAAITFVVGVIRGETVADMLTASVALAVGAIPEGLPAAVTIALAIGVARMARRRAVVRHLPAVETLGSTTVICTDKTGTLTENQMTVTGLWTSGSQYRVTGGGYAPDGEILSPEGVAASLDADAALRWCLLAGALCNDSEVRRQGDRWRVAGDPTEAALLVAAAKGGAGQEAAGRGALRRIASLPFSSARSYMATLHQDGDGGLLVLAKGATERVLGLCQTQLDPTGGLHPLDRTAVLSAAEHLAHDGRRVLAFAIGELENESAFSPAGLAGNLTLVGLEAMEDPIRPAAIGAVRTCRAAGVAVKMITGDHPTTARSIATQLGLVAPPWDGEVVTGDRLAMLAPAEYGPAVARASVFARVSPEQKLRIVEALQAGGGVVAMTGDGVNDAPALRQADIGVAMGRAGTEVAKDAADVVLLDDDFSTIEAAVEEGRVAFDNLVKFIVWTLPTNMGEGLVILAAILMGAALPILPVQILWINMTTAVALGLMLAFEAREPSVMDRPPRDPRLPLLTSGLVVRTLVVAAVMVAGAWWLFQWERGQGAGLDAARTAAVNLFVAIEVVYLFSCRTIRRSSARVGLFSNRWLLVGVAVQVAAQAAITFLVPMNDLFQTAPPAPDAWIWMGAIAIGVGILVGIMKRLPRLSV